MASLMLRTELGGVADDASILVEIFSAAVSILDHVFLYNRKNELFSSFFSVAAELSLHILFPNLDFFKAATSSGDLCTSATSSSLDSSEETSSGHVAVAPLT